MADPSGYGLFLPMGGPNKRHGPFSQRRSRGGHLSSLTQTSSSKDRMIESFPNFDLFLTKRRFYAVSRGLGYGRPSKATQLFPLSFLRFCVRDRQMTADARRSDLRCCYHLFISGLILISNLDQDEANERAARFRQRGV